MPWLQCQESAHIYIDNQLACLCGRRTRQLEPKDHAPGVLRGQFSVGERVVYVPRRIIGRIVSIHQREGSATKFTVKFEDDQVNVNGCGCQYVMPLHVTTTGSRLMDPDEWNHRFGTQS